MSRPHLTIGRVSTAVSARPRSALHRDEQSCTREPSLVHSYEKRANQSSGERRQCWRAEVTETASINTGSAPQHVCVSERGCAET